MTENPTIEEPIVEPIVEGTEAKAPETDVDALVKELEKAGVSTAKELQGKLRASQEAGNLAEMVGDQRKRIADLEQAAKVPPADPDYDYSEGQPIDIEAMMNNVMDKREAKARHIQNQAMQIWQGIQADPDYGLVKEVWETKIKEAIFNMDIQTGKKNVQTEYMETVRKYYKGVAQRSHDTIKALQEGVVPTAPHVEGEAQLPGTPTQTTPESEVLIKAKEKVAKGGLLTEDEEMAALSAVLSG